MSIKPKNRLPFITESLALFIIPFEETLSLPMGSVLRILNITTLILALLYLWNYRKRVKFEKTSIALVGFICYVCLSFIWCFNSSLYFDRLSTYLLATLLILALQAIQPTRRESRLLLNGLYFGGVVISILMLVNTGVLVNIGGRETIILFGRDIDPNYLSFSIVISSVINMSMIFFLNKKNKVISVISLGFVQFILAYSLILLGSRGAVISLVITTVFMLMNANFRKNTLIKRVLIILLVFFISYIFYNNIVQSSISASRFTFSNLFGIGLLGTAQRSAIWEYSFIQFAKRPIFGYGNGTSPYVLQEIYRYIGTHNSYIMVLVEFGIVGFSFFLWILIELYKRCKNNDQQVQIFLFVSVLLFIIFIEGFSTKAFWGVLVILFTSNLKNQL